MQSSMPSQLALAMNFPVYDVCKTGCSPPFSYSVAELDAILHLQGSLYRSGHEFSYVVHSWIVDRMYTHILWWCFVGMFILIKMIS